MHAEDRIAFFNIIKLILALVIITIGLIVFTNAVF